MAGPVAGGIEYCSHDGSSDRLAGAGAGAAATAGTAAAAPVPLTGRERAALALALAGLGSTSLGRAAADCCAEFGGGCDCSKRSVMAAMSDSPCCKTASTDASSKPISIS